MSIPARKKIPIHPGQVIQDMLAEMGHSRAELARHLHAAPATLNAICQGKRGITADMAYRLGKAFQTGPDFWLTLQKNWELSQLNTSAYKHIGVLESVAA